MQYCEKCYAPCEEATCPTCGSLTRPVHPEDFCFLGTFLSPWWQMLQDVLTDSGIETVTEPQRGSSLTEFFGQGVEGSRIYVRHARLMDAAELRDAMMNSRDFVPEDEVMSGENIVRGG